MIGIRAKLVLGNIAAIGLILGVMGFALRTQLSANLMRRIDDSLAADMRMVKAGTPTDPPLADGFKHRVVMTGDSETRMRQRLQTKGLASLYEVVKNNKGAASLRTDIALPRLLPVGSHSAMLDDASPPADPEGYRLAVAGATVYRNLEMNGKPTRSISMPVRDHGTIVAIAQATRDLQPAISELHELDMSLATLIPLALLVAAGAGWLLVGSTMRPLRKLSDSARNLDPDLSTRRLPVLGRDEFASLASTFNEAFDRTSNAFTTQRRAMEQLERFTADAGHELRTPLAAIKGSASFLLHRKNLTKETATSLEIIDAASDRMNVLIQDLLLLARHDSGNTPGEASLVDVSTLVHEVLRLLPRPDGIAVQVCCEPGFAIEAVHGNMVRILTNLLSNAFGHARSRVTISARDADGAGLICVQDDGEGIAPEHLARIGERFYRPESSRARDSGGVGLGLAIVKALLESEGGSLEIASIIGSGTIVTARWCGKTAGCIQAQP